MNFRSRRTLATLAVAAALPMTVTACGGNSFSKSTSSGGGTGASQGSVTVVSQNFTEAEVMTALYQGVLTHAGYNVKTKNFETRDVYLKALETGQVQISADYLSSLTDALNQQKNGTNAPSVATANSDETVKKLSELASPLGLTPLKPAQAEDANAFAVTKQFSQQNKVTTLSDLGKYGKPVALAAVDDCAQRMDCALGLKKVYGITISKVVPLGFGTQQSKDALKKGEVQLAETGTTDGTLAATGLVLLKDDKNWQHAENLVPVVNSAWLAKNKKAADALDKLSATLTTADLTEMERKVDAERQLVSDVAAAYLKAKGLD